MLLENGFGGDILQKSWKTSKLHNVSKNPNIVILNFKNIEFPGVSIFIFL